MGSSRKGLQPAALDTSATEQRKAEHGGSCRNQRGTNPQQHDVTAAPPGIAHACRAGQGLGKVGEGERSEEHTSELQSLMRISYDVFCLKKKNNSKLQKARYTTK